MSAAGSRKLEHSAQSSNAGLLKLLLLLFQLNNEYLPIKERCGVINLSLPISIEVLICLFNAKWLSSLQMELLIAVVHLVPLEPVGEMVFNFSGMTGYQEVLTDLVIAVVVIFTYPELERTGVNLEDGNPNRPQVQCDRVTLPSSQQLAIRRQLVQATSDSTAFQESTASCRASQIRVVGAMNGGILKSRRATTDCWSE